jgi:hypothetical protein
MYLCTYMVFRYVFRGVGMFPVSQASFTTQVHTYSVSTNHYRIMPNHNKQQAMIAILAIQTL